MLPRKATFRKGLSVNDIYKKVDREWENNYRKEENEKKETGVVDYISSFLSLFTRVDSIVAGRSLECKVSDSPALAFTDGQTIFFNSENLAKVFRDYLKGNGGSKQTKVYLEKLAHLRGLNYHELAHCLYTPKRSSQLVKLVLEKDKHLGSGDRYFKIFNLLEDTRIETLYSSRFRNSRYFFASAVMEYIMKKEEVVTGNSTSTVNSKIQPWSYFLVYGRKFLSSSLRSEFRKYFISETQTPEQTVVELENLIDEYRSLLLNTLEQQTKAFDIVVKFCEIMHASGLKQGDMPSPTGGEGHENHIHNKQDKSQKDIEVSDSEEEDEEEDDLENSNDSGDSDDSKDSDDSEEDEEDEDSGDSSDSDDFEDSKDSDEKSGNGGIQSENSSSNPSSNSVKSPAEKSLLRKIAKTLEDISSSVSAEVTETAGQINKIVAKEQSKMLFENCEQPSYVIPTPNAYRALASNLASSLGKLKADTDSQWESGSSNGKFNTLHSIESRGLHYDIFDEWADEGDDRPDAEVVILLDQSSSMVTSVNKMENGNVCPSIMGSIMAEASASMWAIKYACGKHEIPCSVIGYDDEFRALYSANEQVSLAKVPVFDCRGGTRPDNAVRVALGILEKSTAKHKLLFSITDGDWLCHDSVINEVYNLRRKGVSTFIIQLPKGCDATYDSSYKVSSVTPRYGDRIDETKDSYTGASKPKWYGHQTKIQAQDCASLTNVIGRHILRAVIS